MIGKRLRLNRFRYPTSKLGLIVPMDHGLTLGPIEGLGTVAEAMAWIQHPAITGVIGHKGLIERLIDRDCLGNVGVMLHLNGMSALAPSPDRKELLTQVDTAVRLGVDGVSMQLNFDGSNDAHNLKLLGSVADSAQRYALPLMVMVYDKKKPSSKIECMNRLRHLMRIGMELGADALKIAPPADLGEMPSLLTGISEDISIYFAGGTLASDDVLIDLTRAIIRHGAAGLCVGRNIFQRSNPIEILNSLGSLLRQERVSLREVKGNYLEHGLH